MKKVEEVEKKVEKKKPARKPNRQKVQFAFAQSGTAFCDESGRGSARTAGAAISDELVADFRGGALSTEKGDVDKKPESRSMSQTSRCRRKSVTAKSMRRSVSVFAWM